MADTILQVRNLTKIYSLYDRQIDRLKEALDPRRKKYHHDFYALKDISFDVKRGETLGIIGKNGSGKSTLLKIISGVLSPTYGAYRADGSIASLLELGTGFNPELTGIENVYFNGTLFGLSKRAIDDKLDKIVAFADIGEFISQPVKTYSNGMFVRLAFSVAINLEPEILIVDEALSVGDAYFQAKCYERISSYKEAGNTLLLVTHSTGDIVKHCNRALFLRTGQLIMSGSPREVTNLYMEELFGKNGEKPTSEHEDGDLDCEFIKGTQDSFHIRPGYRKEEHRWGNGGARILDYLIRTDTRDYPAVLKSNEYTEFCFKVSFDRDFDDLTPGFLIKTHDGVFLYGTNSFLATAGKQTISARTGQIIIFRFSLPISLNAGYYMISFGIAAGPQEMLEPLDRRYDSVLITVERSVCFWGLVDFNAHFNMAEVNVS